MKLTFPWLSDDYVSDWARTVQPGAGKDRGALVLPEVGDEVLVGFEQGDFRRPYVLGGLYNGVDKPKAGPVDAVDGGSGAINRRSLVSRSGHRLDLLDEDGGPEGVVGRRPATTSCKFVLDATGTAVTLHSDGTVLVEGKQGITVDAGSSSLKLTGSDISLTAKTGVKVDGGSGQVSVQTSGQLSLSGTTAKLAGSGQTESPAASSGSTEQVHAPTGRSEEDDVPPAARVGDPTGHPGVIGPPGVPTVLIAGMPAATVGTPHVCSFPPPAVHPPTAIVPPGLPDRADRRPCPRPGWATSPAAARRSSWARPTVLIGG